jgi:hypothetical protein
MRLVNHESTQEMRRVRDEKSRDLRLELQSSHEEEEKNEKNSKRKNSTVHREEIAKDSLDDHN